MIHDAKHSTGGPYADGSASQMVYMLMANDLPDDGDLVIEGIQRDGKLMQWPNVRVMVHESAKKLGVKIKTRIRNGKMLVWRVVE